jgi:hypothetical protein
MRTAGLASCMALALCGFLACASGGSALKKPDSEVVTKSAEISPDAPVDRIDFAKSRDFAKRISGVRRIAIRYSLPKDSEYTEEAIRSSEWHGQIEKSLIRSGFVICREEERTELVLNEEERQVSRADAVVVIDRVILRRISGSMSIDLFENEKGVDFPYSYYLAEISGKMVLRDNDIIWSCSISASSLGLLRESAGMKPSVIAKGIRDSRYSGKLGKWIREKWKIDMSDNFSSAYSGGVGENFHRRELISYSIKKMFGSLAR